MMPDPRDPFEEGPGSPYDPEPGREEDLWFLPGAVETNDMSPDAPPIPRADRRALIDLPDWLRAESAQAATLARLSARFGALDDRLLRAPPGWRHRLALMETADLSWLSGDRISADQLALWQALHLAGVQQEPQALARAGWAFRRLSGGPGPETGLAAFLGRQEPAAREDGNERPLDLAGPEGMALSDLIATWADQMAGAEALHPISRAAVAFHIWGIVGLSGAVIGAAAVMESAVVAARLAAIEAAGGALFLPLALGGTAALRSGGDPAARLARWYAGAEQATRTAMRHLDRLEAWQRRAGYALSDRSGRTPVRLINTLANWPLVSAPMAESETGTSRAAVQRNLMMMEDAGLIREVTGQARYRIWTADL